MTASLAILAVSLFVILIGAELFTNALEHLGARLGISEGVTGSLFAAVGTALPETMVPLLALFSGSASTQVNEEIGVGAILGAPLMLSTLSTGLMAFSALRQRGLSGRIQPERKGQLRDLHYFLFAFSVAGAAMAIPVDARGFRGLLSAALLLTYVVYIWQTLKASRQLVDEGHHTEAEETMFLARLKLPTNALTIVVQLALGLLLLVAGAKGFIQGVESAARLLAISPLLLSLVVIPVATELPEKINSILWVRRGKDTLAFGNITGAMVFQGTILPAIGIMLTPWQPRIEVLTGVLITLIAALSLRVSARRQGSPIWALLCNGLMYALYLMVVLHE